METSMKLLPVSWQTSHQCPKITIIQLSQHSLRRSLVKNKKVVGHISLTHKLESKIAKVVRLSSITMLLGAIMSQHHSA